MNEGDWPPASPKVDAGNLCAIWDFSQGQSQSWICWDTPATLLPQDSSLLTKTQDTPQAELFHLHGPLYENSDAYINKVHCLYLVLKIVSTVHPGGGGMVCSKSSSSRPVALKLSISFSVCLCLSMHTYSHIYIYINKKKIYIYIYVWPDFGAFMIVAGFRHPYRQ